MQKKLLMFVGLAIALASTASAEHAVRCESVDGRYTECAVNGTGMISMTRQMSDASCIEGRSWGVRNGRIWVDAGCRAEFTLTSSPSISFLGSPQTFVCESKNENRENCRADTRFGVGLLRQISDAPCVRDRTWGVGPEGVWVKDGCRGEFALGTTHVAQMELSNGVHAGHNVVVATPSMQATVVCESINNNRRHCATGTRGGVTLVSQMSDNKCELGRTWGVDADGIWVSGGCRASFAVGVSPMISSAEPVVVTRPVVVTQPVMVTQPAPVTVRPASVVCESVNNGRSHCRIDTAAGISLVRQISESSCVRDRTWGVDKDGVWVTDGCRAEFAMGMGGTTVVTVPSTPQVPTFVCESIDGRRNHCPIDTSLGVTLLRQISDSNCVLNQTWGVDREGVWVNGGCRAEFTHGSSARFDVSNAPNSARLLCESKDGQRNVCPADTRLGVAVVRQISDSPCVLNSTWGFDTNGIWVTAGCRAEFIMRR